MRAAYSAQEIRAAEEPLLAALPDGTLMARAAFALARRCADLLGRVYGARVVVLAGSGGNGGDALYAGAHLARRGARVDAVVLADSAHPGALAACRVAGCRLWDAGVDPEGLLGAADLVIDGMVGIGGTGPLRAPMARIATTLDERDPGPLVVAVDIPSGVTASTGEVPAAAIAADVTVTFGALKAGLVIDPGASYAGRVEVIDIGLTLPAPEVTLLDAEDVAGLASEPSALSDKYRRGVLGVLSGSAAYPGAAALSVGGALATGVGMLRFVGPAGPAELVRHRWPEAVVTVVEPGDRRDVADVGRVQAWVAGPGLGADPEAGRLLASVLASDVPVLLDADAITWLAANPGALRGRRAPTLLTPHVGEFARLTGDDVEVVRARRLERVRAAAASWEATVLLKGSTTLVATPDGIARVNSAATAYLATAGSGDVLSGVCGALLAGGVDTLDAGSGGAFVHGLAALRAIGVPPVSITAMDIVDAIPEAIRSLRR
ncbi:MAG TPA: NAD(P)H-hydrate dehydratase [Mycobacteriales bacterium]|nr:NAD(P)H-hydrate dehydratase [Mycobacteriales bacterium]